MIKKPVFIALIACAITLTGGMIALVSCTGGAPTPAVSAGPGAVSISNFTLPTATVPKGTTVTWTNNDSTPHTVTSDAGGTFDSGTLNPGQTFSHAFATAGSFPYHCNFHSSMHGTITVQ